MPPQNREYLEAKIQTANSAQLHLMLLDGALRFGREAEKGVIRGEELGYQTPLLRTMKIVEELIAGVRHSEDELNEKLAKLYTFCYARLTSVYVNADKQMMAEALQILEFQRETWRQAVEKLGEEAPKTSGKVAVKSKTPAPKPHLGGTPAEVPTTGLSFEA